MPRLRAHRRRPRGVIAWVELLGAKSMPKRPRARQGSADTTCHVCGAQSSPKSFVKARNLHRASAAVAKLVTSPRLAAVAAAALGGVGAVRLYQDSAFFKEPGDRESSWHQVGNSQRRDFCHSAAPPSPFSR